eukprot:2589707-Amphidinium_carterae.1
MPALTRFSLALRTLEGIPASTLLCIKDEEHALPCFTFGLENHVCTTVRRYVLAVISVGMLLVAMMISRQKKLSEPEMWKFQDCRTPWPLKGVMPRSLVKQAGVRVLQQR